MVLYDEVRAIYMRGTAVKCRKLPVTIDIALGIFPKSINPAARVIQ